ncbi:MULTISPECIES: RNA methyltransferase [Nitrosomonas]|uniref:tRNA (cytidine/uridine-2'-O-)-methyltransferase TrmJ n=1 Tax=Nitrosomonas communis TaxID=44574 RepID=A0A0F7KF93_9PROT|nr:MULTISPECIES: RNA methyltransferase [Nitrosomonas]AKH37477.1 tRNA (cytidine/uridine-2'-O-)-methyltransferase [Nitrosomonas communis]TYP81131.1 tRNA/rRNA methyltransferase [Nitrosomonas communis]UVS62719.1 RNA methyltransferase [Nitrosomonas sp. PLL12]
MNRCCPLANVHIVLSHTTHPGNIGATARAMKTMGLSTLCLVNPKSFPNNEANVRASNARDILEQASVVSSLEEALHDTVLSIAMTARTRDLSNRILDARQAAKVLLEHASNAPVALIFGRESSGLTTAEISKCQLTVHIPTNPDYSSLNLAAAVQIMAYELRMALTETTLIAPQQPAYQLANFYEVELFYHHLEQAMIDSGFLDPRQPKRLMQRLRRMFARTQLEKEEVNILRGILSALEKHRST